MAGVGHRTPKINASVGRLGRDRKRRFNWVASSSVVIIINQEISARPRNSRRFAWLRRGARWIIGVAGDWRRGRRVDVFSGLLISCYYLTELREDLSLFLPPRFCLPRNIGLLGGMERPSLLCRDLSYFPRWIIPLINHDKSNAAQISVIQFVRAIFEFF